MAKAKAKRTSSSTKPRPKARRRAPRRTAARAAKKTASRKSARKPLKARRSRPAQARKTAKKRALTRAPARRAAKAPARTVKRPARHTTAAARKQPPKLARTPKPSPAAPKPKSSPAPATVAAAPPVPKVPKAARARSVAAAHGRPAALQRERRRLPEADLVPTPPSSLDLNRTASAARSGQAEIAEALAEHHETGPELTAGDVDANWESAYSTGDEAPGGDNPTPDQDVVDEIGKSLGLVYDDTEELQGANKITERDKHRWELDPASSEDFEDR